MLGKWRGEPEDGDFAAAVTVVGVSFGVLLGLLQVFATNHYRDTNSEAVSEATTLVSVFDEMSAFPSQVRTSAQHTLVCYMRSVVQQDWKAQEQGGAHEAPDTVVRGDRLRNLRATLPQTTRSEQSAYARITQGIGTAGTSRERLLYLSSPQIPTVLWVLVYVSTVVLMFLIVSEFRSRRKLIQHSMLAAVILLLTFEIGVLTTLDHPFGPVARVQPDPITRALTLLKAGHPEADLSSCGPPLTYSS